jgi:hypothetical protein
MSDKPTWVSCLMITEGREHFREFAVEQYCKQTYPHKDFVLVCSPADELFIEHALHRIPDATVVLAPPGSWIPVKRNMALAAATGDVVTWFDDDDWWIARRLEVAMAHWERMWAEHPELKFLDVESLLAYFSFPGGMAYQRLFSSWQYSIYDRLLAQSVPFQKRRRQGSDAYWIGDMRHAARGVGDALGGTATLEQRQHGFASVKVPPIGFATSHNSNICNSTKRLGLIQHIFGPLRKSDYALLPNEWEVLVDQLSIIAERLGIVWTSPVWED